MIHSAANQTSHERKMCSIGSRVYRWKSVWKKPSNTSAKNWTDPITRIGTFLYQNINMKPAIEVASESNRQIEKCFVYLLYKFVTFLFLTWCLIILFLLLLLSLNDTQFNKHTYITSINDDDDDGYIWKAVEAASKPNDALRSREPIFLVIYYYLIFFYMQKRCVSTHLWCMGGQRSSPMSIYKVIYINSRIVSILFNI